MSKCIPCLTVCFHDVSVRVRAFVAKLQIYFYVVQFGFRRMEATRFQRCYRSCFCTKFEACCFIYFPMSLSSLQMTSLPDRQMTITGSHCKILHHTFTRGQSSLERFMKIDLGPQSHSSRSLDKIALSSLKFLSRAVEWGRGYRANYPRTRGPFLYFKLTSQVLSTGLFLCSSAQVMF